MPALTELWAAVYLQVIGCFIVLLLGLPAFLLQTVPSDLRPLVDRTFRLPKIGTAILVFIVAIALVLIWLHPRGENTMGFWLALGVHVAMALAFFLAPGLCLYYLFSMNRRRMLEIVVARCRFKSHRCFSFLLGSNRKSTPLEPEAYRYRLTSLRYLGEFARAGKEKASFLRRLDGLIRDWRYDARGIDDEEKELRSKILPELMQIVLRTVAGDGPRGSRENFLQALDILDELTDSNALSAREAAGKIKLLSTRLIEHAVAGQDPSFKDAVDQCLEQFRGDEAELFHLGELCLKLPPSWGTIPAIVKLRTLCENKQRDELLDAEAYLLGLTAMLCATSPSLRRWAERVVFPWTDDGPIDDRLRDARELHYELGNFAAADALEELLEARKVDSTSPSEPAVIHHHHSLFGLHLGGSTPKVVNPGP